MATNENDDEKQQSSKDRLRKELDDLHQEMEIAVNVAHTGQRRRMPRRETAKAKTKKRKLLEKLDSQNHAITVVEDENEKRLRGSRAAMQDEVVRGSLIMGNISGETDETDDADDSIVESGEEDEEYEYDVNSDEERYTAAPADGETEAAGSISAVAKKPAVNTFRKSASEFYEQSELPTSGRKRKRMLYRLKNFTSYRMAQKHGEALTAHAKGQPKVAVETLKEVAQSAPAAAQIYSSLGLVYENMLNESHEQAVLSDEEEESDEEEDEEEARSKSPRTTDEKATMERQLGFAKKAYGSYHAAAVLCKQDFTLWVRAGDTASQIANIYSELVTLPNTEYIMQQKYRAERKKWIEESKKDFIAADNLKPPGIDVAAKLAECHMELGNLSEALTILTDLKNNRDQSEWTHRAWNLYSDLMLRIGHECMQWNRGIKQNDNFMFRRWLKKYAGSFDWQDRRLQALCLALEAAAGTKSCMHLLERLKTRGSNSRVARVSARDLWNSDTHKLDSNGKANGQKSTAGNEANAAASENSMSEHQQESDDTNGLDMSSRNDSSDDAKGGLHNGGNRTDPSLTSESELAGDEVEDAPGGLDVSEETHASESKALPIAASCSTVCALASELMKHCLALEQYDVGRLAGEAVALYLKERALLYQQRVDARQAIMAKQQSPGEESILNAEPYDELALGASDERDDSSVEDVLSDEEAITENDGQLLDSLRKGLLPPELRVLYGMCLIGTGGRNYVAFKCLGSISDLDDNIEILADTAKRKVDSAWETFRDALVEPLGEKLRAYSMLADVLRKTRKEHEWWNQIGNDFERYSEELEQEGLVDDAMVRSSQHSFAEAAMYNHVLKTVLTAMSMELERVFWMMQELKENKDASTAFSERLQKETEKIWAVVARATLLNAVFWSIEKDKSISWKSVEVLHLLSRSFEILLMAAEEGDAKIKKDTLEKMLSTLRPIFLTFWKEDAENLPESNHQTARMTTFPLSGEFQNSHQIELSLRTYNLCVANNVESFSGWSGNEFEFDETKKGEKDAKYLVSVSGDHVVGRVSEFVQNRLSATWEQVSEKVAFAKAFDPGKLLREARDADWNTSSTSPNVRKFSRHGEDDALKLLFIYSTLCVRSAERSQSVEIVDANIKEALSVLLPLTQFCVDPIIWHSPIGRTSSTWANFRIEDGHSGANYRSFATRRRGRARVGSKKATQTPRPSVPSEKLFTKEFVRVPAAVLLHEWEKGDLSSKKAFGANALEAMRKVDHSLQQLRSCYTLAAVQRASIQVAVQLLNLVAQDCEFGNPFLCLQQAAIFASRGPRGGSNDDKFKGPLPPEDECTPLKALHVIGRSECLQSLGFIEEATFLVSYVANVCSKHRDDEQPDLPWTQQWRVVSICAHNARVAVEASSSSVNLLEGPAQAKIPKWKKTVLSELDRGKMEGTSLLQSLPTAKEAPLVEPFHFSLEPFIGATVGDNGGIMDKPGSKYARLPFEENNTSRDPVNGSSQLNDAEGDVISTDGEESSDDVSIVPV